MLFHPEANHRSAFLHDRSTLGSFFLATHEGEIFRIFCTTSEGEVCGEGGKNRKEKKGKKERDGGREGQELIKIEL